MVAHNWSVIWLVTCECDLTMEVKAMYDISEEGIELAIGSPAWEIEPQ